MKVPLAGCQGEVGAGGWKGSQGGRSLCYSLREKRVLVRFQGVSAVVGSTIDLHSD